MKKVSFNSAEHQHTRLNPLTGQWILVSPHRMKRPWAGQEEKISKYDHHASHPKNPLCPGATRANGEINPQYTSAFVFDNDFPALLENVPSPPESNDPIFKAGPARGTCRVMCFHPQSNKTFCTMCPKEIRSVIDAWIQQFKELMEKYVWVQIFENKGELMGCSNPHPHCQIWACSFLPSEPCIKNTNLYQYYEKYGTPLLDDYIKREIKRKERIVVDNPDWIVVVPYWATWPYETILISRNGHKRISELTLQQTNNLSITIKELTTKYDNLFQCSFPYSMGWHGAPTGNLLSNDDSHWTLHAIYYPPLLKSATVKKFMVGFELLCQPQRDLTPEQAAEKLRNVSGKRHYTEHTE